MLGRGLILALTVYLTMWIPAARAAGPLEDVKGLITEVQTILQTNSEKSKRLDLIEKLMGKHLDFQEMAKRCLGSTWGTLNAGQKAEFVQLVSELLKAHYANHLDDFAKTKVTYQGETCSDEASEVRMVVVRPNDRIPVSFRLLQKPEGWMIYDLNIDGVSMVSNFRTQFSRAITFGSYQGLVARLKAHLKSVSHGCG
ncbi:MAG: ABC transporter substrate-binding protein [Deltaproteobacteria bacterium]|nr:ABC transporter substrate-binding protein [Deltaproteobacteria bacterium]